LSKPGLDHISRIFLTRRGRSVASRCGLFADRLQRASTVRVAGRWFRYGPGRLSEIHPAPYFMFSFPMGDRRIQRHASAPPSLNGIPGALIHGRFDISGPLSTAWQLHKRWETTRLHIPDDAGHGGGNEILPSI
jgi:pimeloyl-ACP methyl ester carboxylesterase